MAHTRFRRLRLDQLDLPQPALRSTRHKLDELVASVQSVGVLVPLIVRALGKDEYAVIAGAGRIEALRRSGAGPATAVPCLVVETDDRQAMLLALVENTVREPLRPFDEAETARTLVQDYGFTQAEVGEALGVSQGRVSQMLRVFELDQTVVRALRRGQIEMFTAEALLPLAGDRPAQRRLMKRVLAEQLGAGAVAALVAALLAGPDGLAPLRYTVSGAGRIDARTTRSGKLRVVLEADDRQGLGRLWRSFSKKL